MPHRKVSSTSPPQNTTRIIDIYIWYTCIQEQLRDEDLTALQIPVLIVKGTKDTFSTEGPFKEVTSRMASPRLEIEMVEKGDHSLSSKTGVGKER